MCFELLLRFKKVFVKGGIKRMKHTIPALIFSIIRLTQVINYREINPVDFQEHEEEQQPTTKVNQKRLFKLIAELLVLIQSSYPEMTLRLNLQAVQSINNLTTNIDLEDQAYEFMSSAYTIFEEDISETESKVSALNLITATLYTITCFGNENFDTLISNCISYSGKLLKKNLQTEALIMSSHLYYCPFKKQGAKVMEQLRKALKTAEACMSGKPENLYLLVKILNTYLFFYQQDAEFINAADVNNLLSFIKETVDEMDDKSAAESSLKMLANTKEAVRVKSETLPRFA